MPTSEAQKRASRAWEERNKEKARADSYRRATRSYLRNKASLEDIEEFRKLLDEREKKLSEEQ